MNPDERRNVDIELAVDPLDIVGHELRTPIAIMSATVDTLRDRFVELDAKDREVLLDVLARHLGLLSAMVGRLATLRDLEQGIALDPQGVDVAELVCDLVDDMARMSDPPRIDVRAERPAVATADAAAMQQILVNLLHNAVRYGGGRPIGVRVVASDGVIEVHVRDHGVGIAPAEAAKIFEPYVRVAVDGPGLGIGLTLGRGLAEAQGGKLAYCAPPSGKGSIFVLTLPRAAMASM